MQVLWVINASLPPHADPAAGATAAEALTDFSACGRMEQLELVGIFFDAPELPLPALQLPPKLRVLNLDGAAVPYFMLDTCYVVGHNLTSPIRSEMHVHDLLLVFVAFGP